MQNRKNQNQKKNENVRYAESCYRSIEICLTTSLFLILAQNCLLVPLMKRELSLHASVFVRRQRNIYVTIVTHFSAYLCFLMRNQCLQHIRILYAFAHMLFVFFLQLWHSFILFDIMYGVTYARQMKNICLYFFWQFEKLKCSTLNDSAKFRTVTIGYAQSRLGILSHNRIKLQGFSMEFQ